VGTYSPKPGEIERRWHVIDANDVVLGRLASQAATLLRGKHKPQFANHVDTGDFVIIVNASKVAVSGAKRDEFRYRHSGYPGGLSKRTVGELLETKPARVIELVILEGVLVASVAAAQRGISLCQSLLRAQLGQRVNVMILEKALTLELQHFEDSEFYDKLTRARREASSRPLSLIMRTFGLGQNGISLVSYAALLAHFSPWAVAVLLLAGLPAAWRHQDANHPARRDLQYPRGTGSREERGGRSDRPNRLCRCVPNTLR